MKNKNFYLMLVGCLFFTTVQGQEEKFELQVQQVSQNIEVITREEKAALKEKIDRINDQLSANRMSYEEAEEAKAKIAAEHAKNIEDRINLEKRVLEQLVKEKVSLGLSQTDSSIFRDTLSNEGEGVIRARCGWGINTNMPRPWKRTTTQLVFAMGLNNLVTDGAVAHSDFRYLGSHFYEIGWTYNSRLFKDDNLMHLKYGISMMYNNLRPTDNRYFIKEGKETHLEIYDKNLKESRLRSLNLVIPVHLEFDFSPTVLSADGVRKIVRNKKGFHVGIGGYAGFNIKTKQILKYNEDGEKYKIKNKNDFRTNDFVYGASAYVGYRAFSLYSKYDISPLFKSNNIDQNNISLGIRADFN